ncbi:hypothetical protein [Ornithinimicrobium faecis]|uniref:hypothetical protein n=1 Tax=Ornithinimicrobium faecis TaxID=2934158 RepID=UPI002119616E|nr:hypothetical protein [Ornithinimicrobium sp. HY1745]
MVGTATPQRHEAPAGAVPREWGVLRLVLLVVLGVAVIGAALTAVRPASMEDLRDALRSGEVTQVHLVGDLPPPAVVTEDIDVAYAHILWHDGLLDRHTHVPQQSGWGPTPGDAAELRADLNAAASGDLSITTQGYNSGSHGYWGDWWVATWVSFTMMLLMLVGLVILFTGPTPRRATRWAWFWLAWGSGGVALLLYPLLGLPRDGQPVLPTGRRLTGGWALLISVFVFGAMFS